MAINTSPGTALRHILTANSSTTWTAPAGVTVAFISVHSSSGGAGGGGSSRYNSPGGNSGTGGIAGAFVQVTPGLAHSITIGAGGAGGPGGQGNGGGAGSTGGTTNFDNAFTVPGGAGGGGGTGPSGGATGPNGFASAPSGTTSLTTLSPAGAIPRVGVITTQNVGGVAGSSSVGTPGPRYGVGNTGGTGTAGFMHVYI